MDSRIHLHIVLPIGIIMLLVGGSVMFLVVKRLKRMLSQFLGSRELPAEWAKHSSLIVPGREVLFGALIVFAVPIFAKYCLAGTASEVASVIVGYVSAGLCALGCFLRQKRDLDELGLSNDSQSLSKMLACFAGGLSLFLCGQLTVLMTVFFVVKAM